MFTLHRREMHCLFDLTYFIINILYLIVKLGNGLNISCSFLF